jgi:hypothetical protein
MIIILASFTCFYSCNKEKNEKIYESSYKSIINEANIMSQIHDSAISFAYNYPGFLKLNKWQRGDVARSYLVINKIQDSNIVSYTEIKKIYDNVNFKDVNSVTNFLTSNKIASNNVVQYVKYVYASMAMDIEPDKKITLINNYVDKIIDDKNLSEQEKTYLIKFIIITKNSANNWRRLLLKNDTSILTKTTQCNDCLGNNWEWIALADGIGGIFGIFAGAPLEAALVVSAGSTCLVCEMCCDGSQDPNYNYPPCCPKPYYFDGANCYLFTPPAGSNPFIQNGNFYWDDPSHACNPPGTPAFWDSVHCCYPVGNDFFLFIYRGGFYIKCNQ